MNDDPNTPGDADPVSNPAGDGVIVSGDEVAQGRSGIQVLLVLVISTVLVALVLFGVFGLHARKSADKSSGGSQTVADNTTAGSTFNTTAEPSPKMNPPPAAVAASAGS